MDNKYKKAGAPGLIGLQTIVGISAIAASINAHAFTFNAGEVTGSLDTTLSYGQLWRVQAQDKDNNDINENDGNRSFDTGLVSEVYKVTSELQANYQNYGVFVRGSAFYDSQIMDHRTDYNSNNDPNQPSQNYPDNSSFSYDTRHSAGRDATLLDAYVFGSWDVADKPLTARLGRQVFNWGEGLFYRGGVNTSNPVDATKYRLPGSEIKEILIPLEAFSFSLGLTDQLSMEAYYQWNWRETTVDPVGTYFSQTDLFADGGNTAYGTADSLAPVMPFYGTAAALGLVGNGPFGANPYLDPSTGTLKVSNIGSDINARDDGQFGVAFRYVAESLNDTEFGFYFVNYHATEPQLAVDFGTYQGVDYTNPFWGAFPAAARPALASIDAAGNAIARREYPEDIRMYGLSFSTMLGDASVFGEVAYRPNLPVAIASSDQVVADIITQGASGVSQLANGAVNASQACTLVAGQNLCRDNVLHNYQRVEAFNTSLGTIYNFGPALTFDSLIGVAEVASEHVRGTSLTYTAWDGTTRDFVGSGRDTFMDRDAYGYTLTAGGTWNNVFAGVNLSPFVVFKNDFKGTSNQTGRFNEGAKAHTLGIKASYLNSLQGELQYTSFYGAGDSNRGRDRDNIGVNVKYSF
ncbi:DUF1302 domain-containing protein [Pseudomonas sp. GV071]|jgi:hypothetical protein|uniref:DUF1302 domain-containing protein n=1 Tax=Pseudomonas sp. GV071 TaxID=2135754 RepID=UPI000D362ED8|nr:DUF1302 domain-containing protein [Pseudomonas sp. GV071]PTQ74345.1 uncharacterized protein DUF1302 [Pseudomonas sp. GV071]